MNYSIKIDLAKLKSAALVNLKGKTGVTKKCMVIPVEDSNLFIGEKGVYLNVSCIELKNPQYDQTHLVKQSLDKETYSALTEDERNALPIIGGMKVLGHKQMEASNESMAPEDGADDLPF